MTVFQRFEDIEAWQKAQVLTKADPGWCYLLINTYGEPPSIVMAPCGANITERFPELLMNYDGIRSVAPEFCRDVVSTCARACR